MTVRPRFLAETIPELEALVYGLGAQSFVQMAAGENIPPLYSGRIVYRREPARREDWQSAAETVRRGYGDCEDLVAYRIAELRRAGIPAWPKITAINPQLRHVQLVRRNPDGQWVIEDPSRQLGM